PFPCRRARYPASCVDRMTALIFTPKLLTRLPQTRPPREEAMTNPLSTLPEHGQSVWLDFLSRDLFSSGELKQLIAEDGLRGMTSNPSIFEKAIGHGEDYDAQIAELEAAGDLDPGALFERLAITD